MPAAPKPYNPAETAPYEPMEIPASVTAPPPASAEQQPPARSQGPGPVSKAGGVAFMADQILRGFARGRQASQMKQVADLKRTTDGLQFSYNTAAEKYYDLVKSGADPNGKEVQEAKAGVDASWASLMRVYGQMTQPGGPKKAKKGKPMDEKTPGVNPLEGLASNDPAAKAQAWYQIAAKAGPPVYHKAALLQGPENQANREYTSSTAQNEATMAKAKQELYTLQLKDPTQLTEPEKARKKQLETFVQQGSSQGGTGTKYFAPRYGPSVTGADIKKMYGEANVPGAAGDFVPDDKGLYREVIYGEEAGKPLVRYEPATASGQLKTTAGPEGTPVQKVFNPYTKQWEAPSIGSAPVRGEVKTVQGTDAQGNPETKLVPVIPPYQHPAGASGHPHAAASGAPAAPTAPTTPTAEPPAPPDRRAQPRGALTPHQEGAVAQAEKAAKEAGVPHYQSIPRYSKDITGKYNAIRAQEMTINGIPGSKTDIGLRQATLNAMDNPDTASKVAVAMKALDTYAKGALSSHSDGDYGWLNYFRSEYSTIPAVAEAFTSLDKDPAGKVYLDNFFRAWTNASTIRSLQGSQGKPTQSMYAMLSQELPMVGVNVSTRDDAVRKLDMLQHDVDNASATLPDYLQKQVQAFTGRKSTMTPTAPTPGATPSSIPHDEVFDKAFGPVVQQPN